MPSRIKVIEVEWNASDITYPGTKGQTFNQSLIYDCLSLTRSKDGMLGRELGRIFPDKDENNLWHTLLANGSSGIASTEKDAKDLVERQMCVVEMDNY